MRNLSLVVGLIAIMAGTHEPASAQFKDGEDTQSRDGAGREGSAAEITGTGHDGAVDVDTSTASEDKPDALNDGENKAEVVADVIPVEDQKATGEAIVNDRPKNRLIEEIVVTARKREENLQDIPISIVAFSADKLEAAGVETAQQLDKITPGLVFNRVIGFTTVFLRGVGSDAYLPSADPSVPIYIDDINSLPSQGSIDSVGNIERIEVLEGPQGTLFGRNALGGAIRIVTADPNDQAFSGKVGMGYGRFSRAGAQTFQMNLFLNVPIAQGLAATVSGIYRDEDPYYTNQLGPAVSNEVLKGGRLKLKWLASDTVDLTFSGSYETAATSGGLTGEGTDPSAILCAACTADPAFDYKTQHNVPAIVRTNRYLISGALNWDLSLFKTKLLVSDQLLRVPQGSGDLDYTSAPLLAGVVGDQYAKQQTAELRIESDKNTPGSEHLTWVLGSYYLRSEGGYDPLYLEFGGGSLNLFPSIRDLLQTAVPALSNSINSQDVAIASYGILNTKSLSGFAEGTYNFFDRLDLTAGLRYDTESRFVSGSHSDVLAPTTAIPVRLFTFDVPKATSDRLSPRVSLKWQFDNAQVYTSYSIGYLSPTYNTVNFFKAPDFVHQEKDSAYELGFKGSYLSGLVKLEGAVFHIERNSIITAFSALTSGGAVSFFNAGDGEVNGAELSVQAQPLPDLDSGLSVIASGSFLDGKYKKFPNGRGYDDQSGLAFGPDSAFGLPARDFSGNRIVDTPRLSGSYTVAQMMTLPGDLGDIELAVDSYYNSGYFYTSQNTKKMEQSSYQTYGARLTYFYTPLGLEIAAYGENLTNERYFSSAVQLDFGPGRSLAAPRQVGLRLKWTF